MQGFPLPCVNPPFSVSLQPSQTRRRHLCEPFLNMKTLASVPHNCTGSTASTFLSHGSGMSLHHSGCGLEETDEQISSGGHFCDPNNKQRTKQKEDTRELKKESDITQTEHATAGATIQNKLAVVVVTEDHGASSAGGRTGDEGSGVDSGGVKGRQ